MLQMRQLLVIKIIVLFFGFSFTSCASKAQIEHKHKDVYKIINNELNNLGPKVYTDKVFLAKQLKNHFFEDLNDFKFNEEYYEYHFLITSYSFTKEEFEYLFNEEQINHYKKQFTGEKFIDSSKIENKNLIIIDIENEKNKGGFYSDKGLIILSQPVFTKNKEYALISYYSGGYFRNYGNSGIAIYKKENNKWMLFRRIGLGII